MRLSVVGLVSLCMAISFTLPSTFAHDDDRRHGPREIPDLPIVFDAQGNPVGTLASFQSAEGVYLDIDGSRVFVRVQHRLLPGGAAYDASTFQWQRSFSWYYSASNCAGEVLATAAGPAESPLIVQSGGDVTLYWGNDPSSVAVKPASQITVDNAGIPRCTSPPTYYAGPPLYLPKAHLVLTQQYPEPLRISLPMRRFGSRQ